MLPVIHAVTDDEIVLRPDFVTLAAQVMSALGERGAVHLRAALLPARTVFAHAERLARMQELTGCWLVVNDRVDVALAVKARGAQLTSRSLAPDDARRVAPDLWLGASVHAAAEAVAAEEAGADWVVAGHVFDTASHRGVPGRGSGFLRELVGLVTVPVVAIGGIRPEHVAALRDEGAHGVAVIRGVWGAAHVGEAAARYLSAHDAHDATV